VLLTVVNCRATIGADHFSNVLVRCL
jgi:hypothetical protein